MRVEVAEGTAHDDLVARFQREDVGRGNTWVDLHEAALVGLERWCCDTHGKHEDVALSGIVGHRVGSDGRLGVLTLQGEHLELLPRRQVFGTDEALVEVLVVVDTVEGRNLYLGIGAGQEVHVLTRRQLNLELLDERCHVLVGDDGTLVFLDAEDAFVDMDFQVAFYLTLASQTPSGLYLLAGEVRTLRVEDFSPTLQNLYFALSATGFSTAGRGKENAVLIQR